MPMQRRAVLPMTVVLGLLTALTLVYAAATVAQPTAEAHRGNNAEAVVRSFYASVNEALRLGDSAALGQVTVPNVKVSGVSPAIETRDQLALHIKNLRAAYPALAIELNDVIADHNWVAARITISGAEGLGPLVTPAQRSGDNELTELFRVEDGMIAEYHGLIANLSPPRQLLHETATTSSHTETAVGVARLTLAPEARLDGLVTLGPTIYAVISGELEVQVDNRSVVRRATAPSESPSVEQIAPGAITNLEMGDQIAIGASVDYSLQSVGRELAVVVATTWMPPDLLGPPTSNNASVTPIPLLSVLMYYADTPGEQAALWPSGVDIQPLLPIVTLSTPSSMISLSLWQTTLAPGTTMTVRSLDGATRLMVDSGRAIIESYTQHSTDEMTVVTAGKSARLNPRDLMTVRNIDEAPLVLSVLVVTPSDDSPTLPLVTPIHLPGEVSTEPKGAQPRTTTLD